jgi:hypothetical protein
MQDSKPTEKVPLSAFKYLGYLTITDGERIRKIEGIRFEYEWNPLLPRKGNTLQEYLLEIILTGL